MLAAALPMLPSILLLKVFILNPRLEIELPIFFMTLSIVPGIDFITLGIDFIPFFSLLNALIVVSHAFSTLLSNAFLKSLAD